MCLLMFCQVVTVGGACILFRMWAAHKQKELEQRITNELSLLVKHEPCQSGAVLNAIGDVVGSAAGRSAKAALMADLAHASRAANTAAVEGAIADVSQESPAIGGLLASLGKNKAKGLFSNPLVQLALQGIMSGKGGNGSSQSPGPYLPPRRHRE